MRFNPNVKLTRETLKSVPPLVTDGAWGTEMQKLGAQPGQICDAWNLEQPEKVRAVAKSYVEAGSQVILTNTFNSNRITLARHRLEKCAADFSRAGARISKEAALGKAYVFASLGPCGKLVMMGEISEGEVEAAFAEQASALEEGGADALIVETQSDLQEAEAAVRGCLKASSLPVGVSFTFDSGKDGAHTMMGVSVEQAYEMATRLGASFVGANCGAGIESFIELARRFSACGAALPIWIKGNAGKPQVDRGSGKTVYLASPQLYADAVAPLLAAGARFIGGCCGSSPDHVRAIAGAMAKAALDTD